MLTGKKTGISMLWILLFMVCIAPLISSSAHARFIRETLPEGVAVTADYRKAEEGKPTILVIHPFLQTHHFSVIANLSDTLVSEGFGVLRPTLSLGIDNRRQSLACEAVHNYPLQDKYDELAFWQAWLKKQGVKEVIGFGHSSGATTVAIYQSQGSTFKSLVLLSPIHYGHPGGTGINPGQKAQALEDDLQGKPDKLSRYKLSFCENFTLPRSRYLEYVKWDEKAVLKMLKTLSVHTDVIFGTVDPSLNDSWKQGLKDSGVHMSYVPGGNHFFSGTAEFDMHDAVIEALNRHDAN